VKRTAVAILFAVLSAASCKSKSDAPQGVASATGSATPAPTDPDEVDRAGAPTAIGSGAVPGPGDSAGPRRERAALPLAPTSMPDPPPPPTARPDAGGYASIVSIFDGYGFPAHPRVEPLCARREYQAGGRHLTWDAFASNDEPQSLVTHYRSRLGDAGFSAEGDGGIWRLPAGARTPQRTLRISRTGQSGPHEGCEKKPGAGAKSVLLLSRDH
jgi:hypothetical protein